MFNIFGFKTKAQKSIDNYYQTDKDRIDFEFSVDKLIMEAWRDDVIDDRKLSSYDRYLLEFKHLDRNGKSLFGLWSNITIYDENLDVVYNAQLKSLDALNSSRVNSKEQMLLELEYWLSHYWERG